MVKMVLASLVLIVAVWSTPARAAAGSSYLVEAATGGSLPADLAARVQAAGGRLVRTQDEIGLAQAESDDPGFAARLAATPGIRAVVRDEIVQWVPSPRDAVRARISLPQAAASPRPGSNVAPLQGDAKTAPNPQGASLYACQWNMTQIDAPGAWAQGAFGSPDVKVAILDTGIDYDHVELAGKVDMKESKNLLTPGNSPCGSEDDTGFYDFDFHGTFCASLITGNSLGVAALAPRSCVVAVKVLNCFGEGSYGDVIAGIHYAAGLPDVNVLSISLGWYLPKAGNDTVIEAFDHVVEYARAKGKLVVVAAGNKSAELGPANPDISIPAQSIGAISITATTIAQQLASYSNYGLFNWLAAPGGDLDNTLPALPGCALPAAYQGLIYGACAKAYCGDDVEYLESDGTSFAAPLVAGAAALVESTGRCQLGAELTKDLLALTADTIGPREFFGNGRLQVSRAVRAAQALPPCP
jgi:thermitase